MIILVTLGKEKSSETTSLGFIIKLVCSKSYPVSKWFPSWENYSLKYFRKHVFAVFDNLWSIRHFIEST